MAPNCHLADLLKIDNYLDRMREPSGAGAALPPAMLCSVAVGRQLSSVAVGRQLSSVAVGRQLQLCCPAASEQSVSERNPLAIHKAEFPNPQGAATVTLRARQPTKLGA
jgi:hypothetical protein